MDELSSAVLDRSTRSAAPVVRRPSPRRSARWAGLDGLRALAVVAVVTFHFAPSLLPGGFLGVDLFFVLSGYLITRMIAEEFLHHQRFRFSRFYLRRARRLLPAVAVVVVAALAASVFWRDQLATVRPAAIAAFGYVSNWWLAYAHQSYFVATGRPSMLQHLWSLAVEEQFYLIWPLVAVLVLRMKGGAGYPVRSARRLALTAGALAAVSTGWMTLLAISSDVPYGADGSRLYFGTDTHGMGLLLGAALGALAAAHVPSGPSLRRSRFIPFTDLIALGALAGLVVVFVTAGQYDGWLYRGGFLGVAALVGCCIAAVTRSGSRVARVLDIRPMRWLAERSYAIYLWHWPIAVVSRPGVDIDAPQIWIQAGRVLLTLALADLTYRFVESPIRSHGIRNTVIVVRRRLRRVITGGAPVGALLGSAMAATGALLALAVLVTGPASPVPAAQRNLSSAGGRNLHLGPTPTRHLVGVGAPGRVVERSDSPGATVVPATGASSAPTGAKQASAPTPSGSAPGVAHGNTRPPSLSAFGDSVMLGARSALGHLFPRGTLDAVEGRQPTPILDDVDAMAAHGKLGQLVVIGVGDNGLINPDDLRHTLDRIRGHRVIVINNRVDMPWESPNNTTIAAVTRHFPNVAMLDWHARSAAHSAWFYDDGIHLTPAGAAAYAAMIARLAR